MKRAVINVYDTPLTGDTEISDDNAYKTKDNVVMDTLKLLNKTAYKKLILAQEDTIYFQIIEESKTKENKYFDAR